MNEPVMSWNRAEGGAWGPVEVSDHNYVVYQRNYPQGAPALWCAIWLGPDPDLVGVEDTIEKAKERAERDWREIRHSFGRPS